MANYIHRPGPCVTLSYNGNGGEWTFPLFDDFSLSVTQKIDYPIQALVTLVKGAISSLIPNSTINTIMTTVDQYQKLMGTELLGKGYYSAAWNGSDPAGLSLKIKAYRGMLGSWDSVEEVYNPLQLLYSSTLPKNDTSNNLFNQQISSPMPSGFDVLSSYGEAIAKSFGTAISNVPAQVTEEILDLTGIKKKSTSDTSNKLTKQSGDLFGIPGLTLKPVITANTWTIDFGYFNGSIALPAYMSFKNCIVTTSVLTYSKEVELKDQKVYPIKGEVTLTLQTESIVTNSDFNKAK
jgi:hypothetical protein